MLYNGYAANGGPRNAADAVFYTATYGRVLHRRFLQTPAHTLGLHNPAQQVWHLPSCLNNWVYPFVGLTWYDIATNDAQKQASVDAIWVQAHGPGD